MWFQQNTVTQICVFDSSTGKDEIIYDTENKKTINRKRNSFPFFKNKNKPEISVLFLQKIHSILKKNVVFETTKGPRRGRLKKPGKK